MTIVRNEQLQNSKGGEYGGLRAQLGEERKIDEAGAEVVPEDVADGTFDAVAVQVVAPEEGHLHVRFGIRSEFRKGEAGACYCFLFVLFIFLGMIFFIVIVVVAIAIGFVKSKDSIIVVVCNHAAVLFFWRKMFLKVIKAPMFSIAAAAAAAVTEVALVIFWAQEQTAVSPNEAFAFH